MFSQVQIFLISCVFGFFLGIIYDLLSVNRVIFKNKNNSYNIVLQDIVYFGIAAILTFLFILSVNMGEIRFYILLAELIGGIVYYVTLRKILNKFIFLFAKIIIKITGKIYAITFFPIVKLVKNIVEICTKNKLKHTKQGKCLQK